MSVLPSIRFPKTYVQQILKKYYFELLIGQRYCGKKVKNKKLVFDWSEEAQFSIIELKIDT